MERVTRKIVQYLNDMEKKAKQMSFTKFKKRSRNWKTWYTKVCTKARAQQR